MTQIFNLTHFRHLAVWDVALLNRSRFIAATIFATVFLCVFAVLAPQRPLAPPWAALLIFLDPAVVGLTFVGGFILLERGAGTLAALGATPLTGSVYVASKVIVFTAMGVAAGFTVAWAATGGVFNSALMAAALALSNAVCVLLGFLVAAPARSVNAFLRNLIILVLILALPLAGFFGLAPTPIDRVLMIIPSYAILILLKAGAGGAVSLSAAALAGLWLTFVTAGAFMVATAFYRRYLTGGGA